ncbi:MAG TPA: TAXI family TRAP transporter solute-binding subunit [Kofleriaceae bacterium]
MPKKPSRRRKLVFWGVVGALMLGVFALTLMWRDPPPPSTITLATGARGDAYHLYGQKLAERMGHLDGPSVEVRETRGSVENLRALAAGKVDVAFVQGGVPSALRASLELGELRSIARVYSEPLWVFHRADQELTLLGELRSGSKRIAIGADGSGTQVIALELLAANGVRDANARLLRMATPDAIAAFRRGEVDVVFLVAGPTADSVQQLLRDPNAKLMSFFNHRAYALRLPYLRAVELEQGQLSLAENLPAKPIVLLAPSATLVARASTHPRVVEVVTRAATDVFGPGNLVDLAGEYPNATALEVPQHDAARRYLTDGESWLSRNVPFWAVLWLERLALILIPLLAVMIPALRVLPAIINWRVKQIIKRHYEELSEVEGRMRTAKTAEELEQAIEASETIEDAMKKFSRRVPGTSLDRLYMWRMHINMVQAEALARLRELRGETGGPDSQYGTLRFGEKDTTDAP